MKATGIISLCLVFLFACQTPSLKKSPLDLGKIITDKRLVSQFEKIEVKGPVDVFLKQEEKEHLEVQAGESIIEFITTKVEENRLYIEWKAPDNYRAVNLKKSIKVFVMAPQVTSICVKGSGGIQGEGLWKFQNMDVYVKGSGDVSMSLAGETLSVAVQGSGDLTFDGNVSHQDIQVAGSADYNAQELQSKTANISVSGSGNATLNVQDQLDIQVFGSGDILYKGNPQLNSQVHGAGHIKKL
jgi:hypothetical protein